jgi:hypothetical protein
MKSFDLAVGRLALHYAEENPDEVNDKTVPRWRGEAARPTTTRIMRSPEKGRFRRWSLPEIWDSTVPWATGTRTA